MCCHDSPCYKCDPGIEDFYQEKVKSAKAAVEYLATTGYIVSDYRDLLDAKDIWYEYCALRDAEAIEAAEPDAPDDIIDNPINSW